MTKLQDKIEHTLGEARMIIPGVQALIGFEFIAVINEGFSKLPKVLQYIHLGSLFLTILSAAILMSPAAFHRISEKGEDTAFFHRLASVLIMIGTIPLSIGICLDFFIVSFKITQSIILSIFLSIFIFMILCVLWFFLEVFVGKKEESK
ncbi:hypothetical protein KW795_00655 [Candidatus Microgenomates bacterium]|nr:hypothetical protein [Candidatus Microgenomates bacterium]